MIYNKKARLSAYERLTRLVIGQLSVILISATLYQGGVRELSVARNVSRTSVLLKSVLNSSRSIKAGFLHSPLYKTTLSTYMHGYKVYLVSNPKRSCD